MANEQEQLVRLVADQVLAAMKNGSRHAHVGEPVSAIVHPPAGVCTGDYSKFEELRGKSVGAPTRAATVRERVHGSPTPLNPLPYGRGSSSMPDAPLRGVVTAKALEGRGKVVRLASCAKLTPLAADFVKANGITLDRGGTSSMQTSAAKPKGSGNWVWWCDGHEPGVEAVASQLSGRIKPLSHQRSAGALVRVIRQLAGRVQSGDAAGGVLFVDSAARAACFANRSPVLRAVVATNDAAVEKGIRELGANVLIVEHPTLGRRSMRDMVSRFITEPRSAAADVERQLRELLS